MVSGRPNCVIPIGIGVVAHFLIATTMAGCASGRTVKPTIGPDQIRAKFPIGCSREDAVTFMTSNGFRCTLVRQGDFEDVVVLPEGGQSKELRTGIDFIRCHRKDGGGIGTSFVTTHWTFAIVLDDNDLATEVLSRREFVGL